MNTTDEIIREVFYSPYQEDHLRLEIYQNKIIESCKPCDGTGYISREELSDYHKREYSTHTKECKDCAASGRVTKTKTQLVVDTRYPFGGLETRAETKVPYPDDPIENPDVTTIRDTRYFVPRT
ncbi:hypothetical protein PHIM7_173 [Sinorhizobium phage phiM7]|uniref:Uncharacterized protein n=2 Tax=Emdodecavirus TaxID=1980937 RepID=S5MVE1_9CAUD|nr:hypothetical protein AB690_gp326 [Sinorhizobium phage phiM12]YP_009601298.1 hypothetical protein FDH46_gp305 [Sinorhizobium phage phiM7]AGR47877.1 hypothetical protein SmphiM12_245 [Sinorhizobium phage phiM12]AKF12718.1 hypothetical protein PHIM7_173 [Sinorhizobium phage phiM7]AKF13078.1 hypothetical protein PHIM19_173 [Sinorhizobium phage phiM19]